MTTPPVATRLSMVLTSGGYQVICFAVRRRAAGGRENEDAILHPARCAYPR